jgi:RND family efflux transporter MFP subunit
MKKRRIIVISAAGLAAAGAWLIFRPRVATAKADATPEIPAVSVTMAVRQDVAQALTVTGELTPFQEVEVMAKVSGYVQKIFVDAGDWVRRGQVLAILEVPEMKDDLTRAGAAIQRNKAEVARYRDEVRRAESAYDMAHLTFARLSGVNKSQPGLVAQQEIDDAQSRDLMAAAQVAASKSALAAAEEQLKVSEAEQGKFTTLINYSRVVAPFDGVVTKRYANTGSMIQAGTASQSQAMPVVRLSQNDLLRLVLPVPESAAGVVKPGSAVDVRIPSLQRVFSGRVARIADKVDTSTRTMETEVDIPNANRSLIPGMYAEVALILSESKNAVTVPLQAVDLTHRERTVSVVRDDGTVERRTVEIGIETAKAVEIRSGLTGGERVVVGRASQVSPGKKVKPVPAVMASKGDA